MKGKKERKKEKEKEKEKPLKIAILDLGHRKIIGRVLKIQPYKLTDILEVILVPTQGKIIIQPFNYPLCNDIITNTIYTKKDYEGLINLSKYITPSIASQYHHILKIINGINDSNRKRGKEKSPNFLTLLNMSENGGEIH